MGQNTSDNLDERDPPYPDICADDLPLVIIDDDDSVDELDKPPTTYAQLAATPPIDTDGMHDGDLPLVRPPSLQDAGYYIRW